MVSLEENCKLPGGSSPALREGAEALMRVMIEVTLFSRSVDWNNLFDGSPVPPAGPSR